MIAASLAAVPPHHTERLYTRCIFCHRPFPENDTFGRVPPGRRIAYDPAHGRLWAVCDNCTRWNLIPIEERADAVWHLERFIRDGAELISATDQISLHRYADITIVRVGRASLAEQAWWRYGRQLRRRRAQFESPGARISAVAYGAVAYIGDAVGVMDVDITWDRTAFADILRWRHFGWAAWHGRTRCPHCNSVLRTLRFDLSWWLYPRFDDNGKLVVGVPCSRCDPWTPRNVFDLRGSQAENVLRRVLAYQHISGANERMVKDAASEITRAGGLSAYTHTLATGERSLWRMGPSRTLALEIALNDTVERRMLDTELHALEQQWLEEERIARIIDEELTPPGELRRHLRRLSPLRKLQGDRPPVE